MFHSNSFGLKWVNFCAFWGPKSAPILIFGVEYLWEPHHEGPHHKAPRPTTHHKGTTLYAPGGPPVGAPLVVLGGLFFILIRSRGLALLICNFLTKTPLFALYSATANGEKSIKEIIVAVSFIWQVCFLLAFFHREYNLCFLTFFAVHFTVNLIM